MSEDLKKWKRRAKSAIRTLREAHLRYDGADHRAYQKVFGK